MKNSAMTEWVNRQKQFASASKLREISRTTASRIMDRQILSVMLTCALGKSGDIVICRMRAAMSQLNLSARVYHRILKLACTIPDLAGCEEIQSVHLAEALQYRPKPLMG